MSPARDIFERLAVGGEQELLAQLRSPDAENDFIDFKESDTRPEKLPNALGESDRATVAEAVSGFYNTAGGVIAWGVRCNDGDVVAARVCEPGLLDGPLFHAALQRKVIEFVRPAVNGIEFKLVPLPSNGRTVLLMYVPPRDGRLPAEANIKQKRGYYFRAGTSFLTIPPDILAGMMGAKPSSRVVPILTSTMDTGGSGSDSMLAPSTISPPSSTSTSRRTLSGRLVRRRRPAQPATSCGAVCSRLMSRLGPGREIRSTPSSPGAESGRWAAGEATATNPMALKTKAIPSGFAWSPAPQRCRRLGWTPGG